MNILRCMLMGLLVVSAAPAPAAPPNGATTGNLNVNDVYLRGAGAWASQTAAVPPKPYTVVMHSETYFDMGSDPHRMDVYTALGLWRLGLVRSQVTIAAWRVVEFDSNGPGAPPFTPSDVVVEIHRGVLTVSAPVRTEAGNEQESSAWVEVDLTWP